MARAEKGKKEPEEVKSIEKKLEDAKIIGEKQEKTSEKKIASEGNIQEKNGNNIDYGEDWFDARKFLILCEHDCNIFTPKITFLILKQ